jgi:F-type H+-transporting ATPase subunit epsilon
LAGKFRCTLVTPEQQLLDADVTYASIPAHDGQIGLMPGRAPLLAKLGDGALRLDFTDGGSRWFFVGGGFAQMKDNKLSLVADEAMPADQIVKSTAEADMKAALARVARNEEEIERKLRSIDRARQLSAVHAKGGGKI